MGENCRYLPAPRGSEEKQSLSLCGVVWPGRLVWALPDDSHSGLRTVYVDWAGLQGSEADTLILMVRTSKLEAEQLPESHTELVSRKGPTLPDKGPPTRKGPPLNLRGRARSQGTPACAPAAFPSTCQWLKAAGGMSPGSPSSWGQLWLAPGRPGAMSVPEPM